jgi:hypothetical protein
MCPLRPSRLQSTANRKLAESSKKIRPYGESSVARRNDMYCTRAPRPAHVRLTPFALPALNVPFVSVVFDTSSWTYQMEQFSGVISNVRLTTFHAHNGLNL